MEILTAINSKQLVPTMRTQYMRTAFQIPFDATVRVSLDTNLCMISERGYDIEGGARWHRDPSIDISESEIARFPHAVLEIKFGGEGGQLRATVGGGASEQRVTVRGAQGERAKYWSLVTEFVTESVTEFVQKV